MCRRLRILPERGEQGYEIWPIKVREKRDESTGDLVASCFKSMTYHYELVFPQELNGTGVSGFRFSAAPPALRSSSGSIPSPPGLG